ncbi:hypothetical protein ANTQUA_LOCUS213 [Anthophora quadrimaculata]
MTSQNYEEPNLRLMKYISKNTDLKVIKHILTAKNDILQIKKRVLRETYEELDNVNYSVWATEDQFCNDIWNFSLQHNFKPFFNQYPGITEISKLHNCKYNITINKDIEVTNTCEGNIVLKLKDEIDIINNQIISIRNNNVEEDLKCCKLTLDHLKSFSEEILKLIRTINISENSLNVYDTSTKQKHNTCMVEGFMSATKLIKQPNFYSCGLTEKGFVSTSTTVIQGSKECYNIKKNMKFNTFVMKKRSLISLKFEQNLKNLE